MAVRIELNHSIPDFIIELDRVFTDDRGRFRFDELLPGGKYKLASMGGPARYAKLIDSLEPKPGEMIDLGTINVTKDERPVPKRTRREH